MTSSAATFFNSSFLKTIAKALVAGGLVYWVIQRGSLNFGMLKKILHPTDLLFCATLMLINILLNNLRWVVLLRGQNFQTSFSRALPLTFIGLFFNFAMPGGVGGDVIKGYYLLQDHQERRMDAATSIFIDRLIGFFSMILSAMLALFLDPSLLMGQSHLATLGFAIIGIFVLFILFFVFAFSRRIQQVLQFDRLLAKAPGGRMLKSIYESIRSYRASVRELGIALGLSVLSQVCGISIFVAFGVAMGFEIPLSIYLLCIPLGLISTALPIAPAGLGVGQAVFLFLFNWSLGTETDIGPSLVTSYQILSFAFGLVGAVFYFRRKKSLMPEAL